MNQPTRDEIIAFLQDSPVPVTRRELARAFGIKGDDRRGFNAALKNFEKQGFIARHEGGGYSLPEGLPSVTVLEVYDIDLDGDMLARPTAPNLPDTQRIEIRPGKKGHPPLSKGDRVLARLERNTDGSYDARVIRRLDTPRNRVLGLVRKQKNKFILQPTDKKAKFDFVISDTDLAGAKDGDIAIGEIQPSRRGITQKHARIVDVLGHEADPRTISMISAHEMGLPDTFPAPVLGETENMAVPELGNRQDLRTVALVTIDGADARDFDDAVYAEETDDGFHLIVAIADVSYYVRPDSALDEEAYRRGNSTYFPDRVIPMLPEALSNNLCSLRPDEDRACLAVHMWIDRQGMLQKYKFVRALMRSKARLTYEQVQAAREGIADDLTAPLLESVINPLYAAFEILLQARELRGVLELDIPERRVVIDENGNVEAIRKRERLDSHKLIEEFMILANVAAASALEQKKSPCVYRVHESPNAAKLETVREFVKAFGLSMPKGQVIRSPQLNQLLKQAASLPYSHLISEVILRAQAQAHYSTQNFGHFGLALERYAHFTSPIRRYADLLVHRSLVNAYGLGSGGLSDEEKTQLETRAGHISETERLSMAAERNAVDRFTAAFLAERVGAEFHGRISGVTRFGLFVQLDETGADGLVPIRTLPQDYYDHIESQHALIGRNHGRVYRMGAPITVRLLEADALTGGTILELTNDKGADIPGISFRKGRNTKNDSSRPSSKAMKKNRKNKDKSRRKGKKPPRR